MMPWKKPSTTAPEAIPTGNLKNGIAISNSDKKLIWNYALERNLRMISDRISKMAGAKIIEKRIHRQLFVLGR